MERSTSTGIISSRTSARRWNPRLVSRLRAEVARDLPAPLSPDSTVVVTTPNVEYNVKFETLTAGKFRHRDHRFEWTRAEFQAWAESVAERFGYSVRFLAVGDADPVVGSPTQMAVFNRVR